jgi:putative protein-disulfide isomerase
MHTTRPILRYVFDPLCGWCYAAAPALSSLERGLGLSIALQPWGLFSGLNAKKISPDVARYIWSNDERIGRMTGLAFSEAYRSNVLEDPNANLDSTLSTRALTILQEVDPQRELALLHRMQRARYVDGKDLTNSLVLGELVAEFVGHKKEVAERILEDRGLADRTDRRIDAGKAVMRQLEASGVPLVVLDTDQSSTIIHGASLYGGPSVLSARIDAAISNVIKLRG